MSATALLICDTSCALCTRYVAKVLTSIPGDFVSVRDIACDVGQRFEQALGIRLQETILWVDEFGVYEQRQAFRRMLLYAQREQQAAALSFIPDSVFNVAYGVLGRYRRRFYRRCSIQASAILSDAAKRDLPSGVSEFVYSEDSDLTLVENCYNGWEWSRRAKSDTDNSEDGPNRLFGVPPVLAAGVLAASNRQWK